MQNTRKNAEEYSESVTLTPDGGYLVQWSHWHDNCADDSQYEIKPGDHDYDAMVRRFPNLKRGDATGYSGTIVDAPSRKEV